MPHKRAKRSVREHQQSERGVDLAPGQHSLINEAVPKSISRVLNATQVRLAWKDKKRKCEEDVGGKQHGKKRRTEDSAEVDGKSESKDKGNTLAILPGESLIHFNRRVEDDMKPLVKSAMQLSSGLSRSIRKMEMAARKQKKIKSSGSEVARKPSRSPSPEKHAGLPKEFQRTSSSAPRRLNDIAQAPPEFKRLPRGAQTATGGTKKAVSGREKHDGVLSMAQKLMMEQEREKAIMRYREMKQKRRGEGGDERDRRDEG